MATWHHLLAKSIVRPADLPDLEPAAQAALEPVTARYPMRVNPYYLALARRSPALWRQCVPDPAELEDHAGMADPLGEEDRSPVPNLVHRYPDRALLLVHGGCAVFCRFCTRKRKVGTPAMRTGKREIGAAIGYIARTPEIRDVLVSGGDPLLLPDAELAGILGRLRAIGHVAIIRIGSRVPCTLPQRVTRRLAATLRRFHPLYVNTHFNHPDEITPEAARACARLADAGIPLGCQTVLLKGVNDDARVLRRLFLRLLAIRVKPYYLFQADLTRGTGHFRTPVEQGLAIMKQLLGFTSGMAVPHFALDAPGGHGKVRLVPDCSLELGPEVRFTSFRGVPCAYPNPG